MGEMIVFYGMLNKRINYLKKLPKKGNPFAKKGYNIN